MTFGPALALARRDLRGGIKGFVLFFLCLMIGVGTIAGVRSVAASADQGMRTDARAILGGDVEVRVPQRPMGAEARAFLAAAGDVSNVIQMRAMAYARSSPKRILVELKAVDAAYPLAGAVKLDPAMALASALERRNGVFGAVVEKGVLTRLGLKLGETLRIGDADFAIRAVILREPDRATGIFSLGPRVMVAEAALPATGLIQPGSLVEYRYRVRLRGGTEPAAFVEALKRRFPDAGWRIVDLANAAPALQRMLGRMNLYMMLVGLSTLLIGGIGVATAVKVHLEGRRETIAVLKCLGATGGTVFAVYLAQVLAVALLATLAGVGAGAALPFVLSGVLGPAVPLPFRPGLYPGALGTAAAFGILTALAFSVWPLAAARRVSPAGLFRSLVAPARGAPRARDLALLFAAGGLLAGLIALSAADARVALWFAAGAAGAFCLLMLASRMVRAAARRLNAALVGRGGSAGLRLGLANLDRPGAETGTVMAAVGLGLVAVVAVSQVAANISREINGQMLAAAPSFFFLDIQPDQLATFESVARSVPGVSEVRQMPSLRGRIVKINGMPVDEAKVAPEARWAVEGDRGLTYAAEPPADTKIVAGSWWPAHYEGPPLVSLDARIADGMGIGVGDTLTVNVLGADITGRIASLRAIDWTTLGINFTIVFAPGALESLPQTHIATVRALPAAEDAVETAVTDALPNVSAIRVRDAIEAANRVLGTLESVLEAMSFVTVAVGLLVLAGAVAATRSQRLADSVVLRVLGARRRDLVRPVLVEFGCLGVCAGALAVVFGGAAGYAVVARLMHADWTFLPLAAIGPAAAGVLVTLLFGLAGTRRLLKVKPLAWLRNE